jgi:dipeptidyl-peptidase-3
LFSRDADADLQVKYNNESLFVIVALHELLGHGTGKLFVKDKEGKFNFDKENLKHPITGGELTFYEHNETWGSKFGKLSSGYEECRADSVALYLSCFKESLEILIPGREAEWDDIVYTAWFDLALSGLKGLPYYSVETSEWTQAHICASYVILQVLIEAGNGFIKIEEAEKNGKPYLYLSLDRSQIHTTGKKAIGDFLRVSVWY